MSELPKYVLVRLSHDVGNPTEIKAEYEPNPDVVPVVRCKDCKHNSKNGGTCDHVCIEANDDWYCADGEKVME